MTKEDGESEFHLGRLDLMAFQNSSPSTCIQQKCKNWGLFTDSSWTLTSFEKPFCVVEKWEIQVNI